jgi:hypothetical protein
MLLSSIHKYIHATMGSVQLSITNLGPSILQNQKYVDYFIGNGNARGYWKNKVYKK